MGKRVIEETASNEIFNDDWFLKDSPTQGTTKLSGSDLKSIMNIGQAESADLADAYDPNHNYVEGDVCIHDDTLHKANDDTTGPWDSTKWDAVTVAELIEEGGKVKDVKVNGTSVVDENKNANVTVPVLDVTVNGGSVVDNNKNAVLDSLVAYGEASGEIATFSDGSDLAMKSLKAAIEPVQDLHGYDAPWVGGAGKNKLPMTVEGIKAVNTYHSWSGNSTTINNVTITIETDVNNNVTGIKFNGTASADITFNLASNITILNGSYIWSNDQTVNISNLWLSLTSPNIAITLSTQKEVNVTVSSGSIGSAYIYASSGNVFNNIVFKPMIRLASVSDSTFAPYSNICPISGWDECKVTRCGKNLFDKTATDASKGYISGKWINQTGNTFLYSNWSVSEYIRVDGEKIAVNGMTIADQVASGRGGYCCYDKYKNVLGGGTYNALTQIITLPTNTEYIRISVWNENKDVCQLELSETATTYEPYNGTTYTIDLDGTRYGGTLDVVSGVLTVDRVYVKGVNVARVGATGSGVKYADTTNMYTDLVQNTTTISDRYVQINTSQSGKSGEFRTYNGEFTIYDDRFTDTTTAQSLLNDVEFCYELATPTTIQLTPTEIRTLLGINNIWADTGDVDVLYVRDLTTTINYILEQLNS